MDVRQKMYNSIYGNPNYRTELMEEFTQHVTEDVTRELEMQFKARGRKARTLLLWIVGVVSLFVGVMIGAVIMVDVPSETPETVQTESNPGEGWKPVDGATAAVLRDNPGGVGNPESRDWESCWIHEGDTTVIVCPDGYTQTS